MNTIIKTVSLAALLTLSFQSQTMFTRNVGRIGKPGFSGRTSATLTAVGTGAILLASNPAKKPIPNPVKKTTVPTTLPVKPATPPIKVPFIPGSF